jgi:hypothetical protein
LVLWMRRRVFLPDLGQGDRGSALEKSFEHASDGLLARPFLSFFHLAKDSVANEGQESWRPILLLNATHEESGNRIITGQFLSNATSLLTAWTRCMSLERTCGQAQRRTTARVSLTFLQRAIWIQEGLGDRRRIF